MSPESVDTPFKRYWNTLYDMYFEEDTGKRVKVNKKELIVDIRHEDGIYFLLVLHNCKIICGGKFEERIIDGINGWWLWGFSTKPMFRRQGIATMALEYLIKWVKKSNHKFIALSASADGRPLYEGIGFKWEPTAFERKMVMQL